MSHCLYSVFGEGDLENCLFFCTFTDRGSGFYAARGGAITSQYKAALAEHALKAYNGDDGSRQPGSLQEVLLHETSVAWVRRREKKTRSTQPWKETPDELASRLRQIVDDVNKNYDVEGLCRALPKRIDELKDVQGDRLSY